MRRPKLVYTAAVLAIMAPGLLACSGGSSFPEVPECSTPTPTPTPRQGSGDFRYLMVMRSGTQALKSLNDDWRLAWPDGKFNSRPEFREEFVVYAGRSRCLAQDLIATDPPTDRFATDEEQLEAALNQYSDAMDFGLEAVRTRNVSEYRDFYKRVDGAITRIDEILLGMPQR